MDYAIKVGGSYHQIDEAHRLYIMSKVSFVRIPCDGIEDALEKMDQLYDGAADANDPIRYELVASIRYPDGKISKTLFPVVRIEPVVREYKEEA